MNEQPQENTAATAEIITDTEFQARQYQEELFETSCNDNTIICLSTGSGKTFIAIMLIKEKQHEVMKPFMEGGKRTIFMAPTVPLVMQQANAIRAHTSLKVCEYYGTKGVDRWNYEKWHEELVAYEVLVMTPKVLVNMLKDSSVKLINRINLLIFDECHSATGNSDYCEVMVRYKDFTEKPLILGLTASVLNGNYKPHRVDLEMSNLEKALCSRIVSAKDLGAVHQHSTKPKEILLVYDQPEKIDFYNKIENVFAEGVSLIVEINKASVKRSHDKLDGVEPICIEEDDLSELRELSNSPLNMLKDANRTLQILGLWCTKSLVDSFLEEMPNLKKKSQEQLLENKVLMLEIVENALLHAQQIWKTHFENVQISEAIVQNISPRVQKMLEFFRELHKVETGDDLGQENHDAFRGIIFVEQRITAWALDKYLQELAKIVPHKYGHLRASHIVGHGGNTNVTTKSLMNIKRQAVALQNFRSGASNLLVSTQVAEEGIDIPKCNVVIRFDLPKNFASYVQSMGRARAEKALFILLVEASKKEQLKEMLATIKEIEMILNKKSQNRDQPTFEEYENQLDNNLILKPYYPTNEVSACVTLNTALDTLYRYCSSLPHDRYTNLYPKFNYTGEDVGPFVCSITLPFGAIGLLSMQDPIVGESMHNKVLARKAAALKACELLHKEGELNDSLKPAKDYVQRYVTQLGIHTDAIEECEEHQQKPGTKKRKQSYAKKVAHDLSFAFPEHGKFLHLYGICVGEKINFGILTSKPIANVYPFTIYGKSTHTVNLKHLNNDIIIDKIQLKALEEFHCFLFQNVLNLTTGAMEFCPQTAEFSFLIVPVTRNHSANGCIEWDLISKCRSYRNATDTDAKHFVLPNKGDVILPLYGEDDLKNRRLHVLEVCHELSPRSPLAGYGSYADYMKIRYDKCVGSLEQPLLLVDYVSTTLNVLHPKLSKDKASKARRQQHQIPEMCKIYPLNNQHMTHAFFLPSILHRINGLLLAQQLRNTIIAEANLPLDVNVLSRSLPCLEAACKVPEVVDATIFPNDNESSLPEFYSDALGALIYQSLTTSSADNWSDMERLEVVGDSFLKYAVSVFLFCAISAVNEGGLTILRTGLVNNFNLYSHAKAKGIPVLLNATMFQPRLMWLPPCFHFPEEPRKDLLEVADDTAEMQTCINNSLSRNNNDVEACSNRPYDCYTEQVIGDKTIADGAEAIIGAVLLSCGHVAALRLIDWLGLKVKPDDYPWTPPTTALIKTQPEETLNRIYLGLNVLEEHLHYTFREKSFLRQALVHPSYTREPLTDNYQKLEFLGDAVLDFLITMHLYKKNPDLSPGEMTDLRSSLVDNATFGYLSVKSGLHKHLKYSNSILFKAIDRYVKHTEGMHHPKDTLYLIKEDETVELEEIEIPKALGDVFEAIAGAIFIDSGLSLKAVWDVYYPLMKDSIERYTKILPINPIRVLLETYSDTKFSKPINCDGSFIVEVHCNNNKFSGLSNKKEFAKQAAAKAALRAFNINPQHVLHSTL